MNETEAAVERVIVRWAGFLAICLAVGYAMRPLVKPLLSALTGWAFGLLYPE